MKVVNSVTPGDVRYAGVSVWFHRPVTQKWLVILTFAVVPVFLLGLFTYYPFVKMIQYSFLKMSYTKVRGFVGFANYTEIFSTPELLATFRISLYY
ncbi:MAG: sugar ABC transporter permease, partial [Eubacteriales bacterium]|nr:sugar ABC transporter permease [Eubacteriales bacterium]